MELNIIQLDTTWNDAASSINENFAKLLQAVLSGGGGGGGSVSGDYLPIAGGEITGSLAVKGSFTVGVNGLSIFEDSEGSLIQSQGNLTVLATGYEISLWGDALNFNGSPVITTEGGAITGNLSVSGTMTVGGNEVIHTGNISGHIPSAPSLPTNPTFTSVKAGVVYVDNNYFYTSSGQQLTAISDTGIKLNANNGTVSVSALGFTFNDSNVLTEATGKSFLQNNAVDLESNQDVRGKKSFKNEMSVNDKLTIVNSTSIVGSSLNLIGNEIYYSFSGSMNNPAVRVIFSDYKLTLVSHVDITGSLKIGTYTALHTGNASSFIEDYTYSKKQIDEMLEDLEGGGTGGDDLTDGGIIDGNLIVTGSLHVGGYEVITTDTIGDNVVDLTSNQEIAGTKNFVDMVCISHMTIYDDTEHNQMLLDFGKEVRLQAINSKLSFDASWLCFNYYDHNDNYQIYFGGNAYFQYDVRVDGTPSYGSDMRYKTVIEDVSMNIETIANAPLFTFIWNHRNDGIMHIGTSAQYWSQHQGELVVIPDDNSMWSLDYSTLGVAMGISNAREIIDMKKEIQSLIDMKKEIQSLKEKIYES